MRIEYLEAEDIISIVNTEMAIYESAISILNDKVEKKDIDRLIGSTSVAMALNFSNMMNFSAEGSRENLEDDIKAILNNGYAGKYSKIEVKEHIIRSLVVFLYRSLRRLSDSLESRKNEVDNASIEVEHFLNRISASIDRRKITNENRISGSGRYR